MRALSLFSGGLDSQLAALLIKKQGLDVTGITFTSPFFSVSDRCRNAASSLGIPLVVLDVDDAYLEVLTNPRYGYGKNMNPCIDCHAYMIKRAGDLLPELDASFIVTGEVLGQRPMSQNKSTLDAVAKHSGYRDLVLRPLSAKLLKPTLPEIEGWVNRDQLLDISGRSRERQMKLAEEYGIKDYPSPAGGCLLTQENYSRKLRTLLHKKPDAGFADMDILRFGRIFFIDESLVVVGRKREENEAIEALARPADTLIKVATHPGPVVLLRTLTGQEPVETTLRQAAALGGRYSDCPGDVIQYKIWHPGSEPSLCTWPRIPAEELPLPT